MGMQIPISFTHLLVKTMSWLLKYFLAHNIIKALKLYVEDNGAIRASASEVLDIIKGYAEKLNIEIEDPLPVTWVTRKINNSIEYLNDMNINFERGKDRRGARFIHLFR